VKSAEKPYALLVQAMEQEGKVAVARFVMRTKQYLAAVRPKNGTLLISTMVYADEVIPAKEIGELDGIDDVKLSERELDMAKSLIESLSTDFEPSRFRDEYRDKVLDLIERKASGEELTVAPTPASDEGKVVDLMAALEASVKEARAARSRHPAAAETAKADAATDEAATDDDDAEEDAEESKPARKKATSKKAPAKKAAARKKSA
jgi:DNA end-binding protein Ku